MAEPRVVIVGTGQGGLQAAASLREAGFAGPVTLIGDEPDLPYQRPPLSKAYLLGKMAEEGLRLRSEAFYAKNGIDLLAGERVAAIDRATRRVRLNSGPEIGFDHLVLATGARNRPLPVPGADLDGVLYLRTLAEARDLKARIAAVRQVVVVGAGFIGLEFAAVARQLGKEVHVVEATQRPMGRAVSAQMSWFFTERHMGWGARLLLGAGVARLLGEGGRVVAVEATDGQRLPADLVVVGIGVLPNADLAAGAGLPVQDGIVVDRQLRTADPAISAIGDCARYPSRFADGPVRLESVQNAADQGRCVAARIAGRPAAYDAVPWFWSDQGDLKLQIVGLTAGHDATALRGDPASGRFSVFCFRGERLVGIELVNRPADHMAGRRLLAGEPGLTPAQAADEAFDLKAHATTSIVTSQKI